MGFLSEQKQHDIIALRCQQQQPRRQHQPYHCVAAALAAVSSGTSEDVPTLHLPLVVRNYSW